jgi:hypothetical protein
MADRPCKPDADLKRLWRMTLPGMSFPACGMPVDFGSATDETVEAEKDAQTDAETRRKAGASDAK